MRIVADENIVLLGELFADLGELIALPGRRIDAAAVRDADVLLVRSVTPVGPELLAGSRVRFVGSTTAGTDHLDLPWLHGRGIAVAWAPGSNAPSVADYVLAALLYIVDYDPEKLRGRSASIIGVGHVGSLVRERLVRLGIRCLNCDPPRAREEGDEGFVTLDEALGADIVTLHVPLITSGRYATRHLLGAEELDRLGVGTVLINTSRGPVIDNRALRKLLRARRDLSAVLDVWEDEPTPDPRLVRRATLATPHVAGYSLDGKLQGSAAVFRALHQFLGSEPDVQPEQFAPEAPVRSLVFSNEVEPQHALRAAITASYSILRDDSTMRAMLRRPDGSVAEGFDALRRNYPLRRDFGNVRVRVRQSKRGVAAMLRAVGFRSG